VDRRAAVRVAAGAAVTGSLLGLERSAAHAAPGNEIVGSWMQLVGDLKLRALETFTVDGGFVATNSQHLDRCPSHGVWVRTGDRTFLVTMHDMTVSIDRRNEVLFTSTVRLEITVDEDGQHHSSRGVREDFDLDGTLLRTQPVTGRASRIVPLPLD
jgi:hypothetical protein